MTKSEAVGQAMQEAAATGRAQVVIRFSDSPRPRHDDNFWWTRPAIDPCRRFGEHSIFATAVRVSWDDHQKDGFRAMVELTVAEPVPGQ